MTYSSAIDFLYSSLPVYQKIGPGAYKPGLGNSEALDAMFGHPHRAYPCIHIAGTNGKGSTAHTLAAILTAAGYRTGLYTSPHIYDFRERIRVDGTKIRPEAVTEFGARGIEIQNSKSELQNSPLA
ncbi:MAG: bifunctional folylpolyglutamate synthase/dihydrofolate synthase, partial [Duncaniella sp.]|nr:bifunctional folylpolyglutamate synthase/dihydrofolate synthase [Duncaniella sp.]